MDREYGITEIFSIVIKRLWIILLCGLLFAAGTFLVSRFVIDKQYVSTVSLYAVSKADSENSYASLYELYYSQARINTYIEIMKTNAFNQSLAEICGLGYGPGELRDMIKLNAVSGTEMLRVQVTTKDPKHSYKIADSFAYLAPKEIMEIESLDTLKVVDPPILPKVPSSPNVLLNTGIGLVIGILLGGVIALILEKKDTRIRGEEDIRKDFDVPVLGIVPRIEK